MAESEAVWPEKKEQPKIERSKDEGKEHKRKEQKVPLFTIIGSPSQGSTALTH